MLFLQEYWPQSFRLFEHSSSRAEAAAFTTKACPKAARRRMSTDRRRHSREDDCFPGGSGVSFFSVRGGSLGIRRNSPR